jgi:hypothetical protein
MTQKKDGAVVAAGTAAFEHYHVILSPQEREQYDLAVNFKPHIHHDPQAYQAARLFLAEIKKLRDVAADLEKNAAIACTVVGSPASWPAEAVNRLLETLRDLKYPSPRCIPEPMGALFFHLATNVSTSDTDKDILVVDWGAGTLDFTLMRNDRTVTPRSRFNDLKPWGSNVYGGRLFDDLFFQWVCDSVVAAGSRVGDLDQILSDRVLCYSFISDHVRRLKERFSDRIRNGEPFPWIYPHSLEAADCSVGKFQFPPDAVAEFERRARKFVPSWFTTGWLKLAKGDAGPIDQPFVQAMLADPAAPIDLLDWAAQLTQEAISFLHPAKNAVAILTGGSTRWPWFEKLITDHKGYQFNIVTDDHPELTIARGLGRAYATGTYARTQLTRLKDAIVRAAIIEMLQEFLEPAAADFADRFSTAFLSSREKQVEEIVRMYNFEKIDAATAERQLNQVIADWVTGEGKAALVDEIDRFGREAARTVEAAMKSQDVRIEGLIKIALEVCQPPGGERFQESLRNVAGRVAWKPGWLKQLYDYVANLVVGYIQQKLGKSISEEQRAQQIEQKSKKMFQQMQEDFPKHVRAQFFEAKSPLDWCEEVVQSLADTLAIVAELAQIDSGEESRAFYFGDRKVMGELRTATQK